MRRYERASTMITSNRPVDDWGKPLGDSLSVTAMLDRLLHHGHVLKCGPRSWRTKEACLRSRRQDRTTYVLDGFQSMAGFELITYGRFSGDH